MEIKIDFKEKDLLEVLNINNFEIEIADVLLNFKDNFFLNINQNILKQINEKNIHFENCFAGYYNIDFPEKINFEVIFVPEILKEEIVNSFELNNADPLGFHAITTGEGLIKQESYYNGKFQTFVFCPTNEQYFEDVLNSENPLNYLNSSLNTLTHEIVHMIIFAKSSGGLSPRDIDALYETSEFDNDIHDCALGCNLEEYEDFYIGSSDCSLSHNDILERIVEEEGFLMLQGIDLNLDNLLEKIILKEELMLKIDAKLNIEPRQAL